MMLNNFLCFHVQVFLLLAIFYFIYRLVLNKSITFQFNRIYLISTALFSVFVPFFSLPSADPLIYTQPKNLHSVQQIYSQVASKIAHTSTVVTSTSYWGYVSVGLLIIYFIGAGLHLIRFVAEIFKLNKLVKQNKIEATYHYYIVNTAGKYPTASFFRYVFWDETMKYSSEEKEYILNHELTHIFQLHSIDNIVFNILKIVFWFNPFFTKYREHLYDVHEFIADDNIIKKAPINSSVDYFNLVAKQVLHNAGFSLTNNFHNNNLKQRLNMIKKTQTGGRIFRMISATALIFTSIAGFIYSKNLVARSIHINSEQTSTSKESLALITLEGQYNGSKVSILNVLTDGKVYSIKKILLNGVPVPNEVFNAAPVFEVDPFIYLSIQSRDKIKLEVFYEDQYAPKILNPDAFNCGLKSPVMHVSTADTVLITVAGIHEGKLSMKKFMETGHIEINNKKLVIIEFSASWAPPAVGGIAMFTCKSDVLSNDLKNAIEHFGKAGSSLYIEDVLVKTEDGSLVKVPGTGKIVLE